MTNPTEKVIINPTEKLRERVGNVLQLLCWNLVSDSIDCSGEMCNKGEGSSRLCLGLEQHRAQILQAYGEWLEGRIIEPLPDNIDGRLNINLTPRDIITLKGN